LTHIKGVIHDGFFATRASRAQAHRLLHELGIRSILEHPHGHGGKSIA
jgi:hypothetical protein